MTGLSDLMRQAAVKYLTDNAIPFSPNAALNDLIWLALDHYVST